MSAAPGFYLHPLKSPTCFNLVHTLKQMGWRSRSFSWLADFSEKNLNFYSQAAEALEFKHRLAKLLSNDCPEVMPVTYCINDENWPAVLQQLANDYYQGEQKNELRWILKPALLNNGKNIKLFDCLSALEHHFLDNKRLGGEHVLQYYLNQPDLLKGHKYSIRMFVVLTDYHGAYLYPQGYFNVALQPYTSQLDDLRPHLTNEHLQQHEVNVIQIPTREFSFFPEIYPSIKAISSQVISSLQHHYPQAFTCHKRRNLAIFGFDFMLDSNKRVWLLEANHGPCFPTMQHPLQTHLYEKFWQALAVSFILPIAQKMAIDKINYDLFEPLIRK